nr:tyrosine protein-kinase [Tanacetum cinerariifolium]
MAVSWLKNSKNAGVYYGFFLPAAFLLCLALLVGTIFVGKDQTEKSLKCGMDFIRGAGYAKITSEKLQPPPSSQSPQPPIPRPQLQPPPQPSPQPQTDTQPPPSPQSIPPMQPEMQTPPEPPPPMQPSPEPHFHEGEQMCLSQSECRPPGSEALPKGLVANTSDLQMQPLWGLRKKVKFTTSLFTAAVGIKQKETVDKMVRKFLSSDFSVMLFHYDGIVDAWKDLDWANNVVHVSAVNQTKWWFAKRFLHPDIVTEYSYIFVWDEDLGVDNFDPDRYLSLVKDEGLEISQPALDTTRSEIHHMITARWSNSTVHRRTKPNSKHGCNSTSDYPPCAGWIEVMAPVFSRAAWRCIWYMIQSDLNHGWGLDILFGYCAQGDRTKTVGVVDAEYIVHYGFPTFGEPQNKVTLMFICKLPILILPSQGSIPYNIFHTTIERLKSN